MICINIIKLNYFVKYNMNDLSFKNHTEKVYLLYKFGILIIYMLFSY